jgi:hypothetical protein
LLPLLPLRLLPRLRLLLLHRGEKICDALRAHHLAALLLAGVALLLRRARTGQGGGCSAARSCRARCPARHVLVDVADGCDAQAKACGGHAAVTAQHRGNAVRTCRQHRLRLAWVWEAVLRPQTLAATWPVLCGGWGRWGAQLQRDWIPLWILMLEKKERTHDHSFWIEQSLGSSVAKPLGPGCTSARNRCPTQATRSCVCCGRRAGASAGGRSSRQSGSSWFRSQVQLSLHHLHCGCLPYHGRYHCLCYVRGCCQRCREKRAAGGAGMTETRSGGYDDPIRTCCWRKQ